MVGRPPTDALTRELAEDPGIRLIEGLIKEFRASMIVGVLRLTARLLMLSVGPDGFRTILASYWPTTPPQMYASLEADAFATHLLGLEMAIPHLEDVLRFERATMATIADGQVRVVSFDVEPLPLLRALAEGRLPAEPPRAGRFEIELTPDGPTAGAGLETRDVEAAFPYH